MKGKLNFGIWPWTHLFEIDRFRGIIKLAAIWPLEEGKISSGRILGNNFTTFKK